MSPLVNELMKIICEVINLNSTRTIRYYPYSIFLYLIYSFIRINETDLNICLIKCFIHLSLIMAQNFYFVFILYAYLGKFKKIHIYTLNTKNHKFKIIFRHYFAKNEASPT
jgi:hypothetical protein